jgi:pentatricopeptide repeat domain-containing protein 1
MFKKHGKDQVEMYCDLFFRVCENSDLLDLSVPVPDAVSLNLLLDQCITNNKLNAAVDLFFKLKNSSTTIVKPDVISYNTLIKGCSIEKKDHLAFKIFIELKKEPELRPKDVTYNSLIDVCVRCNKNHKAWALVKEMMEGS